MKKKLLMMGNEALARAAIAAGCRYYFGYPITPQNEITEYFARHLPAAGGVFIQAESEIAAINMVYGASAAGGSAMTSSSSPGISLKMEGISYLAAAELPCVIANIMRGGPGLGGIQPAQSDYFQAVKGGGHGDYRLIVLAPHTVQEMYDLTKLAFSLTEKYRTPVMILSDGLLGQMTEPLEIDEEAENLPGFYPKPWATSGCRGREKNLINTLYLDPVELEQLNNHLQEKFGRIEEAEPRAEEFLAEDASMIIVAFGAAARMAKEAVTAARNEGIKAGLIRPITLWPFPKATIQKGLTSAGSFLTVEMNAGQMIEDVRLAVNGKAPVRFYGRTGGMLPEVSKILEQLKIHGGCATK